MATRSRFFDSVSGDRSYNSDAWAQWSRGILSEGYVPNVEDELLVTESSPAAMTVDVGLGMAWVDGRYFEVYSAAETLTIPAADGANPRIDRVVVRNDLNARETVLALLEGTPAVTPVAPSLTRDSTTYEISLAQVAVAAGATSVTNSEITDERNNSDVCGIAAPLAIGSNTAEGSYVGDDAASRTIEVGFDPVQVVIVTATYSGFWHLISARDGAQRYAASANDISSMTTTRIVAGGFEVTDAIVSPNDSGSTFYWIATA